MRTQVSPAQLLHVLNSALRERGVPEECGFVQPLVRLGEPDAQGCNWSPFVVFVEPIDLVGAYRGYAETVLCDAAQHYNLQ